MLHRQQHPCLTPWSAEAADEVLWGCKTSACLQQCFNSHRLRLVVELTRCTQRGISLCTQHNISQLPGSLQVLKLVGSPQGMVPAGGVAVLRFVFRPLEAKLHEVTLPVKLADGQLEHLRVVGRGYHPEHGLQAMPVPAQVSCTACQCPTQCDIALALLHVLQRLEVQQRSSCGQHGGGLLCRGTASWHKRIRTASPGLTMDRSTHHELVTCRCRRLKQLRT